LLPVEEQRHRIGLLAQQIECLPDQLTLLVSHHHFNGRKI
jgi:hypothetical protein